MDIAKKDYEGGNSQIVLYQPNETISIEVKLDVDYDTVWLTQAQMVELFASSKANISEHISNIFQQCELQPESTVRKFRIVRKEGAHGGENVENRDENQLSERQVLIYNMLKVNGENSARSLARILNLSQRTVEREISFLRNHGFIDKDGTKNGVWKVLK